MSWIWFAVWVFGFGFTANLCYWKFAEHEIDNTIFIAIIIVSFFWPMTLLYIIYRIFSKAFDDRNQL